MRLYDDEEKKPGSIGMPQQFYRMLHEIQNALFNNWVTIKGDRNRMRVLGLETDAEEMENYVEFSVVPGKPKLEVHKMKMIVYEPPLRLSRFHPVED